jgi:hypothetical protein
VQQPTSGLNRLVFRFVDHTKLHTHTPLNEWPSRCRCSYLRYTQQTHETNIHAFSGTRTRDSNNQASLRLRLRRLYFYSKLQFSKNGDEYKHRTYVYEILDKKRTQIYLSILHKILLITSLQLRTLSWCEILRLCPVMKAVFSFLFLLFNLLS